jgi:threonine/homoserine/homoserine lactone efflux protein
MLLTALNPKFYLVVTVLFTQFLKPGQDALWVVILGFTAVLAFSQFVWLAAGAGIRPLLKSERALRIQSRVFGVLLLLVAVFMLLYQ